MIKIIFTCFNCLRLANSIFFYYEGGCGVEAIKFPFIKKRNHEIIMMDVIIIMFSVEIRNLLFLFIASTSIGIYIIKVRLC
jgi:hypothetical protein